MPRPAPRALLLAALAVAGALAAPAWQGPGRAQQAQQVADLAVLEVLPAQPRVGLAQNVSALVRNLGPEAVLAFNVTFHWNSTDALLQGPSPPSLGSVVGFPADAAAFTDEAGTGPSPCLSTQAGLARNCTVRASFAWTPPESRAGPGTILARAAGGVAYTDPDGSNNEAARGTFVVLHKLRLELDSRDNGTKQVPPDHWARYRVTVRNDGNAPDTARLALSSPQWPEARVAANGTAAPAASLDLELAPGARASALALLRAPQLGATQAQGNLTANTTAAAGVPGTLLALPLTQAAATGGTYAFGLEVPASVLVPAGEAAEVALQARNDGSADDAVRWSLLGLGAGWNASFADEWSALDVPAGTRAATTLRVRADAGLPAAAETNVTVQAASLNGGITRAAPLRLRVPAPDLVLRDLRVERAGAAVALEDVAVYQGDEVLLRVDVANDGTAAPEVPVRLAVHAQSAPTGPTQRVAEEFLSGLVPGQSRPVLVRWSPANLSGALTVTARLDPESNVREHDETNNDAARVAVVRLHGLAVEAPPARDAAPGERLAYPAPGGFAVRNLGNAAERVLLTFRTPGGWANHSEERSLGPGAAVAVPFELQVPELPGTSEEPLVLEARLVNRTATRAENASLVRVRDDAPPALEGLDAPSFVELGQAGRFEARLRDPVGVREATLHLRMPDGALREARLAPAGGLAWRVDVVLAQPGPVGFWLTATDALNHTLDTSGAPGALVVGVRSAPTIELVEPLNDAVVRPGTPLRFRVHDVHGIASVVVQDGPRRIGLEAPYELRTDEWAEGPHDLLVTATNAFGNAATAEVRVTLDATPPRLQDARASPARAAPGEDVRVDARTSEDARVGAVRVLREGAFVREVPARVGLRSLSANLSLDEPGRYTLRLVVEDAAGNEATQDVALEVGAGTPGPALPLLGLALLLAARLAARRRR